jgi:deoxyguanosine kinase
LYEFFSESTPRPALIIFLSATTDLLVERIRGRRRDFELGIDPGYYAEVNAAYEEAFKRYPGKKLRMPMDEWDFVKDPTLYKTLTSLVDGELKIE